MPTMINPKDLSLDTQAVTDFYKGVIQFNQIAGGTRENYNHELQVKLMEEEWKETLKAYNEKDVVEFLDGVLDVLVTYGYAWEMNDPSESVIKDSWQGVETKFSSVVDQVAWPERFDLMEQFCVTLKHKYGVDVEGAMAEVNRSNMSKFCNTSERSYFCSTLIYHCEAINNGGRYTGVTWTKEGDYIVFKDGNGKVMKGPDFTAPDLTPYVGNLIKLFEEEDEGGCTPEQVMQEAYEAWSGNPLSGRTNLNSVVVPDWVFSEASRTILNQIFAEGEDEQIPAKVSSSLSFTPEEVDVMFELLCMTYTEDGAANTAMAKLESYASDAAVQRLETCDQRFKAVDIETGFELNKGGYISLLEKDNEEGI